MKHEEAIKLKPGTPILIRSKVVSVDAAGDIVYETRARDQEYEVMHARTDCRYADVQTPEQKLETCRLFKRGDIVRYVERDGRSYVDAPPAGTTCRVIVGEDSDGMVTVEFKFSENEEPAVHDVPFYHLELITPVEEAKIYNIHEVRNVSGKIDFFAIRKGDITVAAFFCDNGKALPEDEARAEAEYECDRLNN